jgi:succinoglycan biosynthesis protein ExoO
MANWRGERHVGAAVASVLRQTEGSLELLLADDGSDDGSEGAARAAARGDARLRWLPGAARGGPSAARNRALDAARGAWVAVMDSDDLLHPRRLENVCSVACER